MKKQLFNVVLISYFLSALVLLFFGVYYKDDVKIIAEPTVLRVDSVSQEPKGLYDTVCLKPGWMSLYTTGHGNALDFHTLLREFNKYVTTNCAAAQYKCRMVYSLAKSGVYELFFGACRSKDGKKNYSLGYGQVLTIAELSKGLPGRRMHLIYANKPNQMEIDDSKYKGQKEPITEFLPEMRYYNMGEKEIYIAGLGKYEAQEKSKISSDHFKQLDVACSFCDTGGKQRYIEFLQHVGNSSSEYQLVLWHQQAVYQVNKVLIKTQVYSVGCAFLINKEGFVDARYLKQQNYKFSAFKGLTIPSSQTLVYFIFLYMNGFRVKDAFVQMTRASVFNIVAGFCFYYIYWAMQLLNTCNKKESAEFLTTLGLYVISSMVYLSTTIYLFVVKVVTGVLHFRSIYGSMLISMCLSVVLWVTVYVCYSSMRKESVFQRTAKSECGAGVSHCEYSTDIYTHGSLAAFLLLSGIVSFWRFSKRQIEKVEIDSIKYYKDNLTVFEYRCLRTSLRSIVGKNVIKCQNGIGYAPYNFVLWMGYVILKNNMMVRIKDIMLIRLCCLIPYQLRKNMNVSFAVWDLSGDDMVRDVKTHYPLRAERISSANANGYSIIYIDGLGHSGEDSKALPKLIPEN